MNIILILTVLFDKLCLSEIQGFKKVEWKHYSNLY